ncbi:MAG: hypothetical protein JEZ05_07180 [Tenericutes bacterium]|nr:hypothetical protein [Mycoplasmatota bacterium]
MEKLQEQIFSLTEKIVGRFSFVRVVIYTLISAIIILLLLLAFSFPIDLFTVLFAIALSFVYSALRDFFMARYSRKMMYTYYEYLKEKKPGIELYIPLFQKTKQGTLLKKASLYFDKGDLYLEAFNQVKSKRPEESISVKRGRDFSLDHFNLDGNPEIVNYQAKLMDGEINFSLVNITELVNLVENRKEDL